ncbi:MAG TPA: hypothetical protein V6C96_05385 [Vampirovibrionales bacterium]
MNLREFKDKYIKILELASFYDDGNYNEIKIEESNKDLRKTVIDLSSEGFISDSAITDSHYYLRITRSGSEYLEELRQEKRKQTAIYKFYEFVKKSFCLLIVPVSIAVASSVSGVLASKLVDYFKVFESFFPK